MHKYLLCQEALGSLRVNIIRAVSSSDSINTVAEIRAHPLLAWMRERRSSGERLTRLIVVAAKEETWILVRGFAVSL